MMKKIFGLGLMVLFTSTALAQSLFPALDKVKGLNPQTPQPEQVTDEVFEPDNEADILQETIEEPDSNNQIVNSDNNQQNKDAPQINSADAADDEDQEEDDEEDKDDKGALLMYLDNVNSTITPTKSMSFCFATIKLQNQLKKPLSSFQAVLTYGSIPVKVNMSNVAPKSTASQELTLAGSACQQILDVPKIEIKKCVMPETKEKRCISKFIFEPYEG